jgi:competence protein ComEA
MASSEERRAAAVLLALAAAGLVVRFAVAGGATAPGAVAYRPAADDRPGRDSLAARATRLARPLATGERIDVDAAPAEELDRLPRIGQGLAARIVTDREANGPFGSLEGLDRVSGVGPSLLEAVRPYVSFSGTPVTAPGPAGTGHVARSPGDGGTPLSVLRAPRQTVRINTATPEELAQLPGVGPGRARAIVEDRVAHGPYQRLEDLTRVPGIGPKTIERLRGLAEP